MKTNPLHYILLTLLLIATPAYSTGEDGHTYNLLNGKLYDFATGKIASSDAMIELVGNSGHTTKYLLMKDTYQNISKDIISPSQTGQDLFEFMLGGAIGKGVGLGLSKVLAGGVKYGDDVMKIKALSGGVKYSNVEKITTQMKKRGWTEQQIREAIAESRGIPTMGKNGPATRFVHPRTHQSVVIDNRTGEVFHVGKKGYKYDY